MNVIRGVRHNFWLTSSFSEKNIRSITANSTSLRGLIYHHQKDVEDLEAYRPGGYHPVLLSDIYGQNRYHIIHKLGYGSYSTVWLATDQTTNWYVSIKILTANASKSSREA